MSDTLLDITEITHRLEIEDEAILEITEPTVVEILEVGMQGPQGPPGAAQGIDNVVEDTSPQLGGDLDLNGYGIVNGALEDNTLVLEGGLL